MSQPTNETPTLRTKFLDYDARRKPKTEHFCVKCQHDLKPGQPFRLVHLYEGAFVVHPDGSQPERRDVSVYPVGMDCARTIGMEWTRPGDVSWMQTRDSLKGAKG